MEGVWALGADEEEQQRSRTSTSLFIIFISAEGEALIRPPSGPHPGPLTGAPLTPAESHCLQLAVLQRYGTPSSTAEPLISQPQDTEFPQTGAGRPIRGPAWRHAQCSTVQQWEWRSSNGSKLRNTHGAALLNDTQCKHSLQETLAIADELCV